jgi:hypothetical protein
MCAVTQCGCKSGDGVLSTIFSLLAGFVIGLVFLVRKVLVPLVRHVAAPAVAIAAVFVWRWLSGASMTGKARTATFRRGSVPPVRPVQRRFAVRLNWAYWPGYQRALLRWVLTALTVSAALYPLATALTVLTVLTAAITARYRYAIAARFRADVIRVRAAVVHRQATAALTAQADAPVWSTTTEQAAAR